MYQVLSSRTKRCIQLIPGHERSCRWQRKCSFVKQVLYVESRAHIVSAKRCSSNLTEEQATLTEPTFCVYKEVLFYLTMSLFHALLRHIQVSSAQLLKQSGASKAVITSSKDIKTQIAQQLGAGDELLSWIEVTQALS